MDRLTVTSKKYPIVAFRNWTGRCLQHADVGLDPGFYPLLRYAVNQHNQAQVTRDLLDLWRSHGPTIALVYSTCNGVRH